MRPADHQHYFGHTMNNLVIWTAAAAALQCSILLLGCSRPAPDVTEDEEETETLARTHFTDRAENFFEYEPLRAGEASPFLIHLTDLSDGSPVEGAEVTLTVRARGSEETITETVARVGRVTGIYVAELTIARPGDYDIEFHIKNDKLDERMSLSDFTVE